MYALLGICLALASFFAINALASVGTSALWRVIETGTHRFSAQSRAELLFALRIAAPALAAIFVGLFLIPAYIGYEPRATAEVVSIKLAVFALVSAIGLSFAISRAGRSYLATRALRRQWLAISTEIQLPGINAQAFRMPHSFPIIAVIGTIRPRLFIADQVLQSLSAEELAAAIAHECGHLAARDNLKRGLLRACRDALMMVPFGRSLDRSWAETAEAAADEHAAQASPAVALNLASALVTIARMIPVGTHAELPLAAFLVGDEGRGVKARVRRLLELAASDRQTPAQRFPFGRLAPLLSVAFLIALGAAISTNHQVLLTVHSLVERVVSLLS
jgi:Zn-dependent protease with chaperone function